MDDRRFLPRRTEPASRDLDPRLDTLREDALGKAGTTEDFPFGPDVMVFKVAGKVFGAVAWEESPLRVSLKCAPERVSILREEHPSIGPPRYFDKRHWNQVTLDQSISDQLLSDLVDHSYALVVASLPRSVREAL